MNRKAMALIEIVVSMLVLSVAALAVTSTMSVVSSNKMRSFGGGSLDLQAASCARETLESLKNYVSTNAAYSIKLKDSSYSPPCVAPQGTPCNAAGTLHNTEGPPFTGLPAGVDLLTKASVPGTRTYTVWDISSGTGTLGTDVAYKKVTVTVSWTD